MAIMNQIKKLFTRTLKSATSTWSGERESPRYNITLYAQYHVGGPFIERRGNVSIGGFCFEGEIAYSPGTELDLLFRLPGTKEWIHASAATAKVWPSTLVSTERLTWFQRRRSFRQRITAK